MNAARFAVGCAAVLLVGCTTVREYPRCYLFRAPAPADITAANAAASGVLVRLVAPDAFTVTKDGAVVQATAAGHRDVGRAWPSTGCVNLRQPPPLTASSIDKWVVAECQDYLEALGRRQMIDPPTASRSQVVRPYDKTFTCH